jgi:hypothetical protein
VREREREKERKTKVGKGGERRRYSPFSDIPSYF